MDVILGSSQAILRVNDGDPAVLATQKLTCLGGLHRAATDVSHLVEETMRPAGSLVQTGDIIVSS